MQTIAEVLEHYTEVNNQQFKGFHILHIYDTGERCVEDNSGYHCARHMNIKAFNYEDDTMCDFGRHDGMFFDSSKVSKMMVWEDGSFYVEFAQIQEATNYSQAMNIQEVDLAAK